MTKRGRESPPPLPPPESSTSQTQLSGTLISGRENPPPAEQATSSQTRRSPKAAFFHINKIEIGEWTQNSTLIEGLKARIYCGSKKLVWEFDHQETGIRKIEVLVDNIRSMQFSFVNGVMEVELAIIPQFYLETETGQGRNRNIVAIDDFTQNRSASVYSRHKLTFSTETLQRLHDFITSFNREPWKTLLSTDFPQSDELLFHTGSTAQEQGEASEKRRKLT